MALATHGKRRRRALVSPPQNRGRHATLPIRLRAGWRPLGRVSALPQRSSRALVFALVSAYTAVAAMVAVVLLEVAAPTRAPAATPTAAPPPVPTPPPAIKLTIH